MKKKLITVSITIIIAVIGLFILQVDWLFKSLKTECEKKSVIADTVLRRALAKFHEGQNDSVSRVLYPQLKPLADSVFLAFVTSRNAYKDSLTITLKNKVEPAPKGAKEIRGSIGHSYDRIQIEHAFRKITSRAAGTDLRFLTQDTVSEAAIDRIFSKAAKAANAGSYPNPGYFKTDSVRIVHLVKQEYIAIGEPAMAETVTLLFTQWENAPRNLSVNVGTPYLHYRAQGLNGYFGSQRWVMLFHQNVLQVVAAKLVFLILLSCFLTFLLIFSIVYLIKLILKQKQLADMKDDFINNLTHEFKTPIATVSAAIEGLQKFNAIDDKEKTNRYLEISRTELNRLNDMVTKVLNISSYEKKNLDLELQAIDLEAMVNDVVQAETFRAVKPIKFSVNIAPGIKQITADALHLKNVLSNLVDNAVKYSKESVEIVISAYADNGMVHLKIKDNGIGIPASAIKFVFDKFYRVTNGNLYNVKGNGLGLSYVKFVVEAHGGTITLKSEINVGTEFLIAIPLK